jgi:hypothetical protein
MPLPAQMSVPDPVGYDADRLAAFERLNEIRLEAGLGLLAQDRRLDQSAQAHVEWQIVNDVASHVESVGSDGFTGENWWDRDMSAGYETSAGGEVMAFSYSPARGIESLVNVLYHRAALFAFDPVDVGIGWSPTNTPDVTSPLVVEFARPDDGSRSVGQMAQGGASAVVIWPLDGAQGIATHMGDEVPDPVPNKDVLELGTPASISVETGGSIATNSFELIEEASGNSVPTVILTAKNDSAHLIRESFVGLLPVEGLKINTLYRVEFSGVIKHVNSASAEDYSYSWRFTTGDLAYPPHED